MTKIPETSPVYGYLKQPSMVDYPGTLAAVMFTTGCNFQCGFCHNAALMCHRQQGLSWEKLEEDCRNFKEHWVSAISLTGGEPTLWGDSLIRLIGFFRDLGFKIKVDTNGSKPDVVARIVPLVDYIAMDVKCSLESYQDFVGFGDTDKIGESIKLIKSQSADYEFRTTVVECFHTDEEMLAVKALVQGAKRYCLQPFLPREQLPDEIYRDMRRTSPERMEELRRMMQDCADTVELRGN